MTWEKTILNYSIHGGKEYDVYFTIKDQEGNELQPSAARTLSEHSYNRFDIPNENTNRLVITPNVWCGLEGKDQTDYFEVLTEQAIVVEIN